MNILSPLSHYTLCMYLVWCKIVHCRKLSCEISFQTKGLNEIATVEFDYRVNEYMRYNFFFIDLLKPAHKAPPVHLNQCYLQLYILFIIIDLQ